jgi:hypothetical protein
MDIYNKLDSYKKKIVIQIPKINVNLEINKEQPIETIKEEPIEIMNEINEIENEIIHKNNKLFH